MRAPHQKRFLSYNQHYSIKNTHPHSKVLPVTIAVILIIGAGLGFAAWQHNKRTVQLKTPNKASVVKTASTPAPDETPPGDINNYKVAPDLPRFIRISKLNVFARIKKLGVTKTNEIQSPTNIFDAGWYDQSAKPGVAKGAILLDGHVSGPTQPGVFANLKKLAIGDLIEIERGDGQKFTFTVVKSQTYDVNNVDMASALVSANPKKPGLNLITCTGKFDSKTNQYQQRLIVYAVPQ